MNELGVPLLVLGITATVLTILLNNVMWFRFTNTYNRRVGGPMPPLLFYFRGRWYRATKMPSSDPELERRRQQLRWSQVAMFGAYGLVVLGVLFLVWR
jgi:hypothetical protein